MPTKAKTLCQCGRIRTEGQCPNCTPLNAKVREALGIEPKKPKRVEKPRGSRHERGYTYRWVKYRKSFLARNPLCVECRKAGRYVSAEVVDHVEPHRGDMGLFWDYSNHQALCRSCHSRKTASGK